MEFDYEIRLDAQDDKSTCLALEEIMNILTDIQEVRHKSIRDEIEEAKLRLQDVVEGLEEK